MRHRILCWGVLAVVACTTSPAAAADAWSGVVDRVSRAVVAIEVAAARPFDTEGAGVSQATGFVVDGERGLILTNRHVVQPGPVTANAVFLNHEKVRIWPVYRDPVHDFGIFRYDPAELKFIEPGELKLVPGAARVGTEIRVIGNDAGEKLSILAGTLARLDRDAPVYGRGRFNDFNTFYMQAASSSSGGSSGSPVVDSRGRVIGLNAGGSTGAATSFFLPLDRVVHALSHLQRGEEVPRGTWQTVFIRESYDELCRLGLQEETEARFRRSHPDALGLLVVRQTVPGAAAAEVLEPGDILVAIDGEPVVGFAALEARLDAAVGKVLRVEVERGGEATPLDVPVGDLHAITPADFLAFGGGVLHTLSYQVARSFQIPPRGVYLAARGYAFRRSDLPARVIFTHVNETPVPTLDAFEAAVAPHPHGTPLRVRYFAVNAPRTPRVGVLEVDRRWHAMTRCRRNDVRGLWDCIASPEAPERVAVAPVSVALRSDGPGPVPRLARSMVLVRFDIPYTVDGVQGNAFVGTGLVVDAERGWVVVDRDTVPVTLGDVDLIIGGAAKVPGRVLSLHPEHNLALVAYDPASVGDTPLEAVRFDADPLEPGDRVWQVVLTASHQTLSRETTVERVDGPQLPLPRTPRFRETNLDIVSLTDSLGGVGGVLADRRGRVRALWSSFSWEPEGKSDSFFAGVPTAIVKDWLAGADEAGLLSWNTLGVELAAVPLSTARRRGLPDEWARRIEEHDSRARVLAVVRVTRGALAGNVLRVGDLVVEVDGQIVTEAAVLERAAQAGPVPLRIVRADDVLDVVLPVQPAPMPTSERVLVWSGALLQEPPAALSRQRGLPRSGVYVAGRWRGSPADQDQLGPTRRILAIDDEPTPDLDAFRNVIDRKREQASVRLRVEDLNGKVRVLTLEPDPHYWPSQELIRGADGWRRIETP